MTTGTALDLKPDGNGSSGAVPIALGAAALLLVGGAFGWRAVRRAKIGRQTT